MNELFSKDFLTSIGVHLDDRTRVALVEHSEQTLNARIIDAIVELLDERQLEELQSLRSTSQDETLIWLQRNVPELQAVIEDEINILLGDIAESSEAL